MLIFWILNVAAQYFFVPLIAGWVALSTAPEGPRIQRIIGWSLVTLGIWGAISGVPFWWRTASSILADRKYMDQRCQLAMEKLPANRPSADGVVITYMTKNGQTPASFDAMKLVHPGLGRFQRVQEQYLPASSSKITDIQWTPNRNSSLGYPIKSEIPEPNLKYEFLIDSLTTDLDREHGVEGTDFKVIERSTQIVVAHRVQYVQRKKFSSTSSTNISRVCPAADPEEQATCNWSWQCTAGWTLVLRALQPKNELPESLVFHLHRGMAKPRDMSCSSLSTLLVGPGITPADIEWWGEGREGWEDLHLRIRGTQDELICANFFWGGHSGPPSLRFANGSQLVLDRLASKSEQRPATAPQPLPGR